MDKWNNRVLQQHHDRLRQMESTPRRCRTLDNFEPDSMNLSHLKVNLKKIQVQKEAKDKIDKENNELLERLVKIQARDSKKERCPTGGKHVDPFPYRSAMQMKPGIRLDKSQYPMIDCVDRNLINRSMNSGQRQRQAESIRNNNMRMLERLQATKAVYDRQEWVDHAKATKLYLANCRSQEVAHLRETLKNRTFSAHGETMGNSRGLDSRPRTSLPAISSPEGDTAAEVDAAASPVGET